MDPTGDADTAGLEKLDYLSLLSKVFSEVENHLCISDKVVAEFIIDLGRSSTSVSEFRKKLKENDVEMPDYFVQTLLTIIHAILPPEQDAGSKGKGLAEIGAEEGREKDRDMDRGSEGDRDRGRGRYGGNERDRIRDTDRDGDRERGRDRQCPLDSKYVYASVVVV